MNHHAPWVRTRSERFLPDITAAQMLDRERGLMQVARLVMRQAIDQVTLLMAADPNRDSDQSQRDFRQRMDAASAVRDITVGICS